MGKIKTKKEEGVDLGFDERIIDLDEGVNFEKSNNKNDRKSIKSEEKDGGADGVRKDRVNVDSGKAVDASGDDKNKGRKKKKEDDKNGNVKVKEVGSSISEFVKRNVASDEEVEEFDQYALISEKDDEMEKGLARIYEEDDGEKVDIQKLVKRRRMGILGWFFSLLIVFLTLAGGVWGYYTYMFDGLGEKESITLSVSGPEKVIVGEDFVYNILYSNPTGVELEDIEIKVVYPDDFAFIDSFPEVQNDDYTFWKINKIGANTNGMIEIKGKMIGEKGKKEIVLVNMTWSPVNSEAEFRREQAIETVVSDIGLDVEFESDFGVMSGQVARMSVNIKPQARNFLNNFILRIEPRENIELIDIALVGEDGNEGDAVIDGVKSVVRIDGNTWRLIGVNQDSFDAVVDFKVLNKINREESLDFVYEVDVVAGDTMVFGEESVLFGVSQNDFNVSLILNGSTGEQGADFGDVLNYSLIYSNQGEIDVHDVVLMAVLDGDVLDWSSYESKYEGVLREDTVSWTFKELPELKSVKSDHEGIIDFSLKIADLHDMKSKLTKVGKYEVDSYAQYVLGFSGTSTPSEIEDTKSNVIKIKLNSDLTLDEDVRYFNDDNIAVGSGPIPPQVGDETVYRVYWRLTNNLHKVSGLNIRTKLPQTSRWVKGLEPNIGNLNYDASANEIVWSIGDLPIAEIDGVAEFDIGVTPTEENKGKVMVLLTGTSVAAQDKETDSKISIITNGKTTKLDDDEIAQSDGIVK